MTENVKIAASDLSSESIENDSHDSSLLKSRKTREEKISYAREYYKKNKEKIAQRRKLYREKNKEAIACYAKSYREKNKGKIAVRAKEYREANKDNLFTKQIPSKPQLINN